MQKQIVGFVTMLCCMGHFKTVVLSISNCLLKEWWQPPVAVKGWSPPDQWSPAWESGDTQCPTICMKLHEIGLACGAFSGVFLPDQHQCHWSLVCAIEIATIQPCVLFQSEHENEHPFGGMVQGHNEALLCKKNERQGCKSTETVLLAATGSCGQLSWGRTIALNTQCLCTLKAWIFGFQTLSKQGMRLLWAGTINRHRPKIVRHNPKQLLAVANNSWVAKGKQVGGVSLGWKWGNWPKQILCPR